MYIDCAGEGNVTAKEKCSCNPSTRRGLRADRGSTNCQVLERSWE